MNGNLGFSGDLKTKHIMAGKGPGLTWKAKNYLRPKFLAGLLQALVAIPVAKMTGTLAATGRLEARLIRANGEIVNYGLLSNHSVTNAFVNFLAAQLVTDTTEIGDFKFHDSGVGTTAENVTDTAMETTDGESRATGNQTNPTSPTYRSVGTISYTTTKAITEHGVFSQSTGATLMDRSVFSAINVVNGDSIQFTYTLTLTAGG